MGCSKCCSKREFYNDTNPHQKTRKVSNKQQDLTTMELEKQPTKPQVDRRKKIIKIRVEINE